MGVDLAECSSSSPSSSSSSSSSSSPSPSSSSCHVHVLGDDGQEHHVDSCRQFMMVLRIPQFHSLYSFQCFNETYENKVSCSNQSPLTRDACKKESSLTREACKKESPLIREACKKDCATMTSRHVYVHVHEDEDRAKPCKKEYVKTIIANARGSRHWQIGTFKFTKRNETK